MSELAVWMNGEQVATWTEHRGAHRLHYQPSWLASPRCRSLSLSLPITPSLEIAGPAVKHYFDNLLPDNKDIRERARRRYGAKSTEVFDLLTALGRDCVGAAQLLPLDATPDGYDQVRCRPLTEEDVERRLVAVTSDRPEAVDEMQGEFRISLAGAQEKTAFLWHEGQWCLPLGATPTTHIMKLPLGIIGGMRRADRLESIENEWLCLHLMQALGFRVAQTEMARFGDQKVLVVERFDRGRVDGRGIARWPQEDFCQAMGLPPSQKYENEGGPGLDRCLTLLRGGADPWNDRAVFLLGQLVFWMLGATDGHAKNFSVFLHAGDTYALTPFYDVLSIYPMVGKGVGEVPPQGVRMAMGVKSRNKHWYQHEIQPRHWASLAKKAGLPSLLGQMVALAHAVPVAIAHVESELPADFPARIWDTITLGLRKQAQHFLAGLEADEG
ncbi:type II toxin-antitoxin system HipA family toxin [Caldimonas brevitalea]|uniref:Toxin HipA n=1 Tax=Caldimonas brevitalea TaxID=413882 RepID=A0A0G3BK19_9BURK|nr:type II toxin-antitoxin system HipA family toxin [Caldimonas brevitalea]AKJ26875.1 toxin HipA [Caldimonas brevitalea]